MKLIKSKEQAAQFGLPASHREWWSIGDGYEVYIDIGGTRCLLTIDSPESRDITLEIAKYLGVDITSENIKFGAKEAGGRELYLSSSIDCVLLNYTKPKNHKELLEKIEMVIYEYFNSK